MMLGPDAQLMALARIAGLTVLWLVAGCAAMESAPESVPPATSAAQEKTPVPQQAAPRQEQPVAARPTQEAPKPDRSISIDPAPPPAAPAANPPAKVAAPPAPREPVPKKEIAAPVAAKPAAMDLTVLEKRLKETPAIGVFTKLTLKNQVDDLLDLFRAYYQGQTKTTLAALRQPYDQLILKVLSLLQDGDPPLARAIVESREVIWGILSDPVKFKNL